MEINSLFFSFFFRFAIFERTGNCHFFNQQAHFLKLSFFPLSLLFPLRLWYMHAVITIAGWRSGYICCYFVVVLVDVVVAGGVFAEQSYTCLIASMRKVSNFPVFKPWSILFAMYLNTCTYVYFFRGGGVKRYQKNHLSIRSRCISLQSHLSKDISSGFEPRTLWLTVQRFVH